MLKHHALWTILTQRMLLVINIGRKGRILLLGYSFMNWSSNNQQFSRIFDINEDGFVSKEEFGWMTSSKIIGVKEIEGVFQVL